MSQRRRKTRSGVDVQWILDVAQMNLPEARPQTLRRLAHRAPTVAAEQEGVRGIEYDRDDSAMLLEVHGEDEGFPKATIPWLEARQRELADGLTALQAGNGWTLPAAPRMVGLTPVRGGDLVPRYTGSLRAVLYAAIRDTLIKDWSSVRKCEGCGLLFVVHDARQKFHSVGCGQKKRNAEYTPKRQRDYAAEYQARVGKRTGQTRFKPAPSAKRVQTHS